MNPTPSRTPILYPALGMLLVLVAILLSAGSLAALAGALGVSLHLAGPDSVARVWALKFVMLVVGLPLLFYGLRRSQRWRWLFDVSVGLLILLVLLLLIEGAFGWLNRRAAAAAPAGPATSTTFSEPYVVPDPDLGYRLKPSLRVTATQKRGDAVEYQKIYTTDALRRRLTPVDNTAGRTRAVLFFGGSFTFGDGLSDDETLPAAVGRAAPQVLPLNYGVSGYGPQHTLALLQSQNLRPQVGPANAQAVFTLICPHVGRAVGSMLVVNTWGKNMPFYALEGENLVRHGDFVSGRPALSALYAALGASQTARYFNLQLPRLTDWHYDLTARILLESAREFARQLGPDASFAVLIYPGQQNCAPQISQSLQKIGVPVLDYSTLISRSEKEMWQADGHPTAAAQQAVANKLVQDLGLGPAPEVKP